MGAYRTSKCIQVDIFLSKMLAQTQALLYNTEELGDNAANTEDRL